MPHIIVEHSSNLGGSGPDRLMQALHQAALGTGLFDEGTIKVRLRAYDQGLVGGRPDDFAHVTIYLIDGRDKDTKKRLATVLHATMRSTFPDCAAISVDVRDLDREIYTKSQR